MAKFNRSLRGVETSIITSTGPYVITWNFNLVLKGKLDHYQIKKYDSDIVANHFLKTGEDKSIVVVLPHDVTVAKRVKRT